MDEFRYTWRPERFLPVVTVSVGGGRNGLMLAKIFWKVSRTSSIGPGFKVNRPPCICSAYSSSTATSFAGSLKTHSQPFWSEGRKFRRRHVYGRKRRGEAVIVFLHFDASNNDAQFEIYCIKVTDSILAAAKASIR
jgi:hypothetical protein